MPCGRPCADTSYLLLPASSLAPSVLVCLQAKIAAELPGRTDNEVKNFWNGRQKRIIRAKQLAARPASGGQALPRSLPCQPPAAARPWMARMAGHPASSSSWPPPAPFLPRSSLPPRGLPPAPPGRSCSSSAGSGLFTPSAPPAQRNSQSWAPPPHLPSISRGFWLPPLVIPEVPPLEDDDDAGATSPGQPALSSPPHLALPEGSLGSSLYPPYRHVPPQPQAWRQPGPPPAWGPQEHGWAAPSLRLPNTLSPPPKPPVVRAAMPAVDAFLISPSEAGEDGFLHDWQDNAPGVGPVSRKRSRADTFRAGDEGTMALADAWRWAPVQDGELTWDGDSGTVGPGWGRSVKRCKLEESEGECESGISFDTPGGCTGERTKQASKQQQPRLGLFFEVCNARTSGDAASVRCLLVSHSAPAPFCADALSGCLLSAPLSSPAPSSWPAWLDEASPRHRLEVEAAAASLYPTATAFLASVQPEWGAPASETGLQWALPPLVPVEELGTCVGEDGQGERLAKIASWSNFLCAAAGL